MRVALATDNAYLQWAAVAILSCLDNCSQKVTFHVLLGRDVPSTRREQLVRMTRDHGGAIELHDLDDATLAVLPSKGPDQGDRLSWARVSLPTMLPDVDRILYLDADVLVRKSLDELWELDLGGAPLAAIANVSNAGLQPHLASLGIENPRDYFNAGVLVIDLEQWRTEGAGQAIIDYAVARPSNPHFDQDALNVVFADRWLPLHPRWNAMNSLWFWTEWAREVHGENKVREATADPAIVHFEGPSLCKPWHYLCEHPFREEHRRLTARTPWEVPPLEDRTVATRLIARLPAARRLRAFLALQRARQRMASWRRPRAQAPCAS
ncbi:MAG: hypothetical protein QOD92_1686 [Acidimicrobiaceae bacterium]